MPASRRGGRFTWPATGILAALLLAALVAVAVSVTRTPDTGDAGRPPATDDVPSVLDHPGISAEGTASGMLDSLRVAGRAPQTGYDRERFGERWADVDRNGCDTRNDILARDLSEFTYANEVPCRVGTGTLRDPFTGDTVDFLRGQDTSALVPVDHVVSLSDAWQKGAQQLSFGQRTAFANDPLNLQATSGWVNRQKSDADAATWLPPNTAYRCEFVARQIGVKAKYELWVTPAERDAMAGVLGSCPDQPGLVSAAPAETSLVQEPPAAD